MEFCQIFGFKQTVQSPTRVTHRTSTLIAHILRNTFEKLVQFKIINIRLSDHQLVFCTRQTKKEKVGEHKQILFSSFKKYLAGEFEKALGKVMFQTARDIVKHVTIFFKNRLKW